MTGHLIQLHCYRPSVCRFIVVAIPKRNVYEGFPLGSDSPLPMPFVSSVVWLMSIKLWFRDIKMERKRERESEGTLIMDEWEGQSLSTFSFDSL